MPPSDYPVILSHWEPQWFTRRTVKTTAVRWTNHPNQMWHNIKKVFEHMKICECRAMPPLVQYDRWGRLDVMPFEDIPDQAWLLRVHGVDFMWWISDADFANQYRIDSQKDVAQEICLFQERPPAKRVRMRWSLRVAQCTRREADVAATQYHGNLQDLLLRMGVTPKTTTNLDGIQEGDWIVRQRDRVWCVEKAAFDALYEQKGRS